jgi:hypothetical protein
MQAVACFASNLNIRESLHPTTMLDLDYSDSDASDFEQTKKPQLSAPLLATATSPKKQSSLSALLPKPKLRKQKDPDAPKKIILNLPKIMQDDEDDRPVKKAKLGGGSGLSAMLPAPKRSMAAKKNNDTVASPAKESEDFTAKVAGEFSEEKPRVQKPTSAINTMFVPQSVAKKPIQPTSAFKKNGPKSSKAKTKIEPAKPKISLFGSGERGLPIFMKKLLTQMWHRTAVTTPNSPRPRAMRPVRAGEYKPLMLDAAKPIQEPVDEPDVFHTEPSEGQEMTEQNSSGLGDPEAQDLDSLARQMGLGKHEVATLWGALGGEIIDKGADAPIIWPKRPWQRAHRICHI